jgi:thioredoxin-related protein
MIPGESKLIWYAFDEGMEKARTENKQVLIDVYTEWCGWCKTMDAKTYSNEKIINYLNEKYILIKLNPETDGEITYRGSKVPASDFARSLGVSGYPSTVFFESNARMITLLPGYVSAEDFLPILEYIAEKKYTEMSFDDFLKSQSKN